MTSITDIIADIRKAMEAVERPLPNTWSVGKMTVAYVEAVQPSNIAAVLDALEKAEQRERELVKHLERAIEAMEPLSDAVFNDNGDITTNIPTIHADDCEQAYFVSRAARRFIEAHTGGEDAGN